MVKYRGMKPRLANELIDRRITMFRMNTLESRVLFAGIAVESSGANLVSWHMLPENGTFTLTAPVGTNSKLAFDITSGESEAKPDLGLTTIFINPIGQSELKQKVNLFYTGDAKLHIDMRDGNDKVLIGATGMIGNSPFANPENPNLLVAVIAGTGNDRVEAVSGSSSLMILAGEGHDTIYGSQNDDYVDAAQGNDHIFGRGGNDRVTGGTGLNKFDGGSGNDQYLVNMTTLDQTRDVFIGGLGLDTLVYEGPGFSFSNLTHSVKLIDVEMFDIDEGAWG